MTSVEVHTISIPEDLAVRSILSFAKTLHSVPHAGSYRFDFSRMQFVEPFALLFLAHQLSDFRDRHRTSTVTGVGYDASPYAGHMGFFKAFGLSVGKEPAEARGSETYLPIVRLSIPELCQEAGRDAILVQEVIEQHTVRMTQVLTRSDSGPLFDTVQYSLCELIRNAVEHSESEFVEYCAQYWPTRERVELAILDSGVGIGKTLSRNRKLRVESDRDALHMSLLPGISRSPSRRRSQSAWDNSGYGLYMTSRLCAAGGSFVICSGTAALRLNGDAKDLIETAMTGTALQMRLDTRALPDLRSCLSRFTKEGDAIAKQLRGASELAGATASRMVREQLDH